MKTILLVLGLFLTVYLHSQNPNIPLEREVIQVGVEEKGFMVAVSAYETNSRIEIHVQNITISRALVRNKLQRLQEFTWVYLEDNGIYFAYKAMEKEKLKPLFNSTVSEFRHKLL